VEGRQAANTHAIRKTKQTKGLHSSKGERKNQGAASRSMMRTSHQIVCRKAASRQYVKTGVTPLKKKRSDRQRLRVLLGHTWKNPDATDEKLAAGRESRRVAHQPSPEKWNRAASLQSRTGKISHPGTAFKPETPNLNLTKRNLDSGKEDDEGEDLAVIFLQFLKRGDRTSKS